jgi:hypothetical protein
MSMQPALGLANRAIVQYVMTNIMEVSVCLREYSRINKSIARIATIASRSASAQWLQYQRLVVMILTKEMITEDPVVIQSRSTSVIKYDIGRSVEIRWHVSWFGSLPICCQHIFGNLLDNADKVPDSFSLNIPTRIYWSWNATRRSANASCV